MYRADAAPDRSILVTAFSSRVFGLDRQTGQIRWLYEMGGGSTVEIAILDKVVVAVDRAVIAFIDYATGRVFKTVPLAGSPEGRPTMLIDGPHVYVSSNGEVSCYNATGDALWLQPFTGHGYGAMCLALPGNVRQADSIGSR